MQSRLASVLCLITETEKFSCSRDYKRRHLDYGVVCFPTVYVFLVKLMKCYTKLTIYKETEEGDDEDGTDKEDDRRPTLLC